MLFYYWFIASKLVNIIEQETAKTLSCNLEIDEL